MGWDGSIKKAKGHYRVWWLKLDWIDKPSMEFLLAYK